MLTHKQLQGFFKLQNAASMRAFKASKGPWRSAPHQCGVQVVNKDDTICDVRDDLISADGKETLQQKRNGQFIGHARKDVTELCKAVKTLLGEYKRHVTWIGHHERQDAKYREGAARMAVLCDHGGNYALGYLGADDKWHPVTLQDRFLWEHVAEFLPVDHTLFHDELGDIIPTEIRELL